MRKRTLGFAATVAVLMSVSAFAAEKVQPASKAAPKEGTKPTAVVPSLEKLLKERTEQGDGKNWGGTWNPNVNPEWNGAWVGNYPVYRSMTPATWGPTWGPGYISYGWGYSGPITPVPRRFGAAGMGFQFRYHQNVPILGINTRR